MGFDKIWIRLMHGVHLSARPMTLGVRAAAFDAEGRVFLVRHTYVPGWYLPGGGVDPGETVGEAMERELSEEGNLVLGAAPVLFAVYFNNQASRRDHVIVYRCDRVSQSAPKAGDTEIAETGFFDLDDLPPEVTPATLRRLDELAGRTGIAAYW